MLMVLSGLYYKSNNSGKLVITNFPYMDQLNQGVLEEDELKTKKHSELFKQILSNFGGDKLCLCTKYSLKNLTTAQFRQDVDLTTVKDDTGKFLDILNDEIKNEDDIEKKLCFMDMRAEHTLGYSNEGGEEALVNDRA